MGADGKPQYLTDPRVPKGGSIGPGGIILDEWGNPVLGEDGKPLYADVPPWLYGNYRGMDGWISNADGYDEFGNPIRGGRYRGKGVSGSGYGAGSGSGYGGSGYGGGGAGVSGRKRRGYYTPLGIWLSEDDEGYDADYADSEEARANERKFLLKGGGVGGVFNEAHAPDCPCRRCWPNNPNPGEIKWAKDAGPSLQGPARDLELEAFLGEDGLAYLNELDAFLRSQGVDISGLSEAERRSLAAEVRGAPSMPDSIERRLGLQGQMTSLSVGSMQQGGAGERRNARVRRTNTGAAASGGAADDGDGDGGGDKVRYDASSHSQSRNKQTLIDGAKGGSSHVQMTAEDMSEKHKKRPLHSRQNRARQGDPQESPGGATSEGGSPRFGSTDGSGGRWSPRRKGPATYREIERALLSSDDGWRVPKIEDREQTGGFPPSKVGVQRTNTRPLQSSLYARSSFRRAHTRFAALHAVDSPPYHPLHTSSRSLSPSLRSRGLQVRRSS